MKILNYIMLFVACFFYCVTITPHTNNKKVEIMFLFFIHFAINLIIIMSLIKLIKSFSKKGDLEYSFTSVAITSVILGV